MAKLTEVYSEKQFKKFQPVMICNIEKQQEGNKKIYSRSLENTKNALQKIKP